MLNKRLSSSQTFLCVFKTVFVFIRLCAFCAFYKVICLTLYAFCAFVCIKTSKMKNVICLTLYAFCAHKSIYDESHFLWFLCLWDLFLKDIKLPQYHQLLYFCNHYNIFHHNFYDHNLFLSSPSFFSHHNILFQPLWSFSIVTIWFNLSEMSQFVSI